MELSWIVTLPPLCVFIVAFYTHNVLYALSAGIISACLISAKLNLVAAAGMIFSRIFAETDIPKILAQSGGYDHAYTIGFLIGLGIIIELMTHAGGLEAYAALVRSWIRSRRSAETVPLVIAPLFFLDDYLNNLVGGSVVRPIFDKFSIARAKLAYLLNALSSSQCLLIPASSWLTCIIMQLKASGVSSLASDNPLLMVDPYSLYLKTIPYICYPLLSIFTAWFVVRRGISYGPMHKVEQEASAVPETTPAASTALATPSLSSFFVPLGSFLIGIPAMLLLLAGWTPWGDCVSCWQALSNTDELLRALWWASVASCTISILFLKIRKHISWRSLADMSISGFLSMKNSIALLILAWTLSSLLKYDVPTGAYLAQTIMSYAPQAIIPLLCFITATVVTASIGSSWGMMLIMIPIVLPLVITLSGSTTAASLSTVPLLLPALGAIFSGAAAGPQFSPITDGAIISSATARISPLLHIKTMIPYALPGLIISCIAYLIMPYLPVHPATHLGTILLLFIVTGGVLSVLNRREK